MRTRSALRRTRRRLTEAWERHCRTDRPGRTGTRAPQDLRPEIVTSWERSAQGPAGEVSVAPLDDADGVRSRWEANPLRTAVGRIESQLRQAAEEAGLVVAVTDPAATILWTCEGPVMRALARGVNFVPGGRWDEDSVGTNALDLALRLDQPTSVFSAEHFNPLVHDWSCWAAPVHDPATGRQLGVVDLSTTWDRAHPMAMTTAVAFARLLEQALPNRPAAAREASPAEPSGTLELRLLGRAEAFLDGIRLLLKPRRVEILALLALHPAGLSLEALHACLYGDRQVSRATLKADVSHLRTALGGSIASRPYRLTLPVRCDAADVLACLRQGRVLDAASAYGGDLMPGTEAPGLAEYGNHLAVAMREALLAAPEPEAVLRYADAVPYDVEVLEHAVRTLGDRPDAAAPLLRARLRAASDL